jgi:N-acetylglucosaminyl-diphospho-decaprenol L-rhamnosyltransferase
MTAATSSTLSPPGVVSVVVVSYNTRDWLLRCLGSLPEASSHELDVIVVDNASADGSADAVAGAFPTVRLIRNGENAGFGRAVNQGAALARGDRLLLVNPDGYLEPGAIDALVAFADAHPEYVICGGRTVTPAGELDPRSCWGAPTLWSLLCSTLLLSTLRPGSRVFDPEALGGFRRDRARPVDIVTGCLLLVSTADWAELGGFDERYFVYGEDADLCLRATATTGRQCAITPDAVMVHAVGASSATPPDKRELLLRGRITVVRTHLRGWRGRAGGALIVGGVLARAALERAGAGREAGWDEVWRRRRRWWRGYPPAAKEPGTGRSSLRTGTARQQRFLRSVLDPRSLLHAVRLLHYFHYTHVAETGKLTLGPEVRFAPNVSFANAERIRIGARSRVGARCSLWAGDHDGAIRIGSDCNFAPQCFLTASNYGIEAGTPFLDQPKHDADIEIGDDVWLGTGVIVLAGVTIGSGTVVAAGSVVTRDLPPGVVAGGVPAKALRER